MTARYDVSFVVLSDKLLIRYGGWTKEYELDADAGDVSRFIGAIVKMNVEKLQRAMTNQPPQAGEEV